MNGDIETVTITVERLGHVIYKGDFRTLEIKSSKDLVMLHNELLNTSSIGCAGERTTLFATTEAI